MTIKERAIKLSKMFFRALVETAFDAVFCFIALVIGASIVVHGWMEDSSKIAGAWLALMIFHAMLTAGYTVGHESVMDHDGEVYLERR